MLPEPQIAGSGDAPLFRLAARIQSRRELKPKTVRWLSDRFKALTDLVSLRWISPVISLGSNDQGDFRPWSGPLPGSGRVVSGAPLNLAGGAVGACPLVLEREGSTYALSAGHSVRDLHENPPVGRTVYCEPQPITPSGPASIGVLERLGVFDSYRPGRARPSSGGAADFAIIKLSDDATKSKLRANHLDGQSLSLDILPIPLRSARDADSAARGLSGRPVKKSAAKTRVSNGHLNAIGLTLECIDPVTRGCVTAHDLVEVVTDHQSGAARPGDSGALLSVCDRDALPQPFALLFGAQAAGRLDRINGSEKMVTSLYGVPLSAIEPIRGMRLL